MSNYTLLANLFVVPLITMVIMPLGVLGVILMPIGLDYYVLQLMGFFINMIVQISDFVANTKGSVWYFGYITPASVLVYLVGLFWVMLWSSRIRIYGFLLIIIACVMMCFSPKPDVIFDASAGFIAVKNKDGELEIVGNKLSKFHQTYLNNWFGQKEPIYRNEDISEHDYLIETASGKKVAILYHDTGLRGDIALNMTGRSTGFANELDRTVLESSGAVLIFCDEANCRAEYESNKRFKFS